MHTKNTSLQTSERSWQLTYKSILGIAALIILAAIAGCASIGNPSGGPRDERAPRLVGANPPSGTADIPLTKERFVLTFDELVEVKDASSKVIVSPPSRNVPRVAAQGRHVTVTFQDSLLPNTTYTIDFADAIQDLNEGNRLTNFAYTFSTGPVVDSLRIAGRVLSAQGMEPMQLKLVGLHRVVEENLADEEGTPGDHPSLSTDSAGFDASVHKALFTKMFDYVGRTDDRGRFSIEGLAPGRYRIYALDDTNSDRLFTNADEEVAFSDVILSPSTQADVATDSLFNLRTGELDTVVQRQRTIFLPNDILLRSALSRRAQQFIEKYERVDSTRINLLFHVPNAEIPEVRVIGMPEGSDPFQWERTATNDTLSLWIKSPALAGADTLRLAVGYHRLDSLQRYELRTDTLRLVTDRTAINRAAEQARKRLEQQAKKIAKQSRDKELDADSIAAALAPKAPLITLEFPGMANQQPDRPLRILASVPPVEVDTAAIRLEEKVDTLWRPLPPPRIERDSLNPRLLTIVPASPKDARGPLWQPGKDYRLILDSLALMGRFGFISGPAEQTFKIKEDKQFCTLTIRLADWPAGRPAYAELLNQSDAYMAISPVEGNTARFAWLAPGKYYLRLIDDRNANLRWDSGDPLINLMPEEAFYYPKAINIKPNWNKDETWSVFAVPADMMKPESLLKNKPTPPKNQKTPSRNKTEEEDEEE